MSGRHMSTVLGVAALAAFPAAAVASGGKISHAKLFQNKPETVVCGIEIHLKHKPATNVICAAANLPVSLSPSGDPFIQISAHHKPRVVYLSQDSYISSNAVTLHSGAKWSNLGVTCTIGAKTVKCVNKSGHGFTIGKAKYKPF